MYWPIGVHTQHQRQTTKSTTEKWSGTIYKCSTVGQHRARKKWWKMTEGEEIWFISHTMDNHNNEPLDDYLWCSSVALSCPPVHRSLHCHRMLHGAVHTVVESTSLAVNRGIRQTDSQIVCAVVVVVQIYIFRANLTYSCSIWLQFILLNYELWIIISLFIIRCGRMFKSHI